MHEQWFCSGSKDSIHYICIRIVYLRSAAVYDPAESKFPRGALQTDQSFGAPHLHHVAAVFHDK